jgi:hypothetical protein
LRYSVFQSLILICFYPRNLSCAILFVGRKYFSVFGTLLILRALRPDVPPRVERPTTRRMLLQKKAGRVDFSEIVL